eukprot:TRINITY_DN867_c1_g1_i1.p2 TRINITY_DN867_c1_g1~~TRINITY_DN867_c1_g1_i1.p2  ORF type:complete len:227 (+),score=90.35 TRINITY_DN867_c1_g1_i1:60-740(+)
MASPCPACPTATETTAAADVLVLPEASDLQAAVRRAKKGDFPALCPRHFRGTCRRGAACPLMHGADDERFAFESIAGVALPAEGSAYSSEDGGRSIVLASRASEKVCDADVADYGDWMGMDVATEGSLAWIARLGLTAPVPAPWRSCKTDAGEVFYFNFAQGATAWEHPLDAHVQALYDEEKGVLAARRAEARRLVLAFRRREAGFGCLLGEMVSWVVTEAAPFAR